MVWISPPRPINSKPPGRHRTLSWKETSPAQQAGGGPGVVLTGSLSEASPSAGQTPCECVGAIRAGRPRHLLGPPSPRPQRPRLPLPLPTAGGQQAPAGFREASGKTLHGIDHGWVRLEGPTGLHWHVGVSGGRLGVSPGWLVLGLLGHLAFPEGASREKEGKPRGLFCCRLRTRAMSLLALDSSGVGGGCWNPTSPLDGECRAKCRRTRGVGYSCGQQAPKGTL